MKVYRDLIKVMRSGKQYCTCSICESFELDKPKYDFKPIMSLIACFVAVMVFLALFTVLWYELFSRAF